MPDAAPRADGALRSGARTRSTSSSRSNGFVNDFVAVAPSTFGCAVTISTGVPSSSPSASASSSSHNPECRGRRVVGQDEIEVAAREAR